MVTIPILPSDLAAQLVDAHWAVITSGASDAKVWRLTHPEWGQRFLKIAALNSPNRLIEAYRRLIWAKRYLPVSSVVGYTQDDAKAYLLTEALPGVMPYDDLLPLTLGERLTLLAQAARQIHALPVAACPFDSTLAVKFALIRQRIAADAVQISPFAESHPDCTMADVYTRLIATQPAGQDIVVTHGDLYPVNILVNPQTSQLSGFVDVGRLGLADRYADLALIVNTIRWHFDETWIPFFFKAYGIEQIDREKLAYYQFLGQFF